MIYQNNRFSFGTQEQETMTYSINSVLVESVHDALCVAVSDFLYAGGLNDSAFVAAMDPDAALAEVRECDLFPVHIKVVKTGRNEPINAFDDDMLSIIREIIQEARQS